MTKEQTLQALEICKDVDGGIGCGYCPYLEKSALCLSTLLGDAYNLLQEYFKKEGLKND